ncbi:MAG: hypothetical protein LCH32_00120 [Bacteroidetes bacterium]|nr:hypothetical protein [Bacteroidota bacterium]
MNRVWTYLINKNLSSEELQNLNLKGNAFVSEWTAHENKLTASFELFKSRIIIVKVNETVTEASGCSVDKLLRFIKLCEQEFNIQLLNRLLVAINLNNEIQAIHSSEIKTLLLNGSINPETQIYDTSISNENELNNWIKPLKNTWLNKYL